MDRVQCKLCKGGNTFQTTWIPLNFAKRGKVLKIQRDDKSWDEGWVVKTVFTIVKSEDYLKAHERDYKKTRKSSDI